MIYNKFFIPKVNYTPSTSFEQGMPKFMLFHNIMNYKFYIINSFMILGPIVLFVFLFKLFKNNKSVRFLIIPFLLTNFVLAIYQLTDVWYFLLSSVIMVYIFIKYVEESKNKKLSLTLLSLTLLYFMSYDAELLYYALHHTANDVARQVVLSNSSPTDSVLVDGICDLHIPQSPMLLRDQIAALKEVGGSTGVGLVEKLKTSEKDSSQSRRTFVRVEDYFWGKTKYAGRWLIGCDSNTLKKFHPNIIVLFSRYNNLSETYVYVTQPYGALLDKDYNLIAKQLYTFPDPRMNYRNYYYFHSFFIYKRKNS